MIRVFVLVALVVLSGCALGETAGNSAPSGFPGNPVVRNRDWTPSLKEFSGVSMVFVPVGCFRMGSEIGDPDESPVSVSCIEQPFWIDRTEVTNAQFLQFNGVAEQPSAWSDLNRPRVNVRWTEARDFCKARDARLPTELEWEWAARGPDSREYPWGDTWQPDALVQPENANAQTAPVGSRPGGASWVGALDMAGNVWEWTSTLYDGFIYPYFHDDGRETPNNVTSQRVIRGGSWYDITDPFYARAANRGRMGADMQNFNVGLRCARDF
jgi:formylglycine-generating enzyme required for sulfatase activity